MYVAKGDDDERKELQREDSRVMENNELGTDSQGANPKLSEGLLPIPQGRGT